jgi:hypothetical protein
MVRVGDVVQIRGERDEQIAQVFGTNADPTIVADARLTQTGSDQQEGSSHSVGLGN